MTSANELSQWYQPMTSAVKSCNGSERKKNDARSKVTLILKRSINENAMVFLPCTTRSSRQLMWVKTGPRKCWNIEKMTKIKGKLLGKMLLKFEALSRVRIPPDDPKSIGKMNRWVKRYKTVVSHCTHWRGNLCRICLIIEVYFFVPIEVVFFSNN